MKNWHTRPMTNDLGIIDQIYTNNVCHLPDNMAGMVMIDIGAHIGGISVLAAERGANVYAFEPRLDNFLLLLANAENLAITAYCVGIGPFGSRKLYIDPYNTGMASTELLFPELKETVFEYITTITFKAALDMLQLDRIDFVKIDCEGCEDFILGDMLDSSPLPQAVSVEFHRTQRNILKGELADLYSVEQFANDSYMLRRK